MMLCELVSAETLTDIKIIIIINGIINETNPVIQTIGCRCAV